MMQRKWSRRLWAWLLALVMVAGLVTVPAGEAKAAEIALTYTSGSQTSNPQKDSNDNYNTDVSLGNGGYSSISALKNAGITTLRVTYKITSATTTGTLAVQPYMNAKDNWKGKWITDVSADGVERTAEFDISQYHNATTTGGGDPEVWNFGIQFCNASSVTYEITGACLVKSDGSSQGGGGSASGGTPVTSDEVTVIRSAASGSNNDYKEWSFAITNNTDNAITGVQIVVPISGTVPTVNAYGLTAVYNAEVGGIIVYYSKTINAHATVAASDDIKIGYSANGVTTGDSYVLAYDCGSPTGSGGSSGTLNYELTGQKKTVAYSDTPLGKHGKLSLATVAGYSAPVIVDKNGKPFQLRGASTHGMHWGEMHPYVNKDSFQSLRDEWGVNMVRLVSYVTQGGYTEGSQATLDTYIQKGVTAATDLGMYAIVDWHIHAENPWDKASEAETFFKKYAQMYKDNDNVIYEICNEPTGVVWYNGSGQDLYSYCKKIATVIRQYDPDALIICGTNTWSQDVDDVSEKPLKNDGFSNILYTFHFYSGSHYSNLMDKVKNATAAGTPIFVTEFGICDASGNGGYDTDNADAWIALCDNYNISYACWSLSNKNESASYLLPSCTKTAGGWLKEDLSTTGIWLVNTYRAHQEAEEAEEEGTIALDSLSLNKESTTLVKGETETLVTTISPADAEGVVYKWTSSDKTVATVDTTGKITAVKSGTANITVAAGGKTATCKVTVTTPVTGITLNKITLTLTKGGSETLTATITPTDADDKTVAWSSNATEVATVDSNGKVTAKKTGTATITATVGGKSATCTVTVTTPVTKVSLNKTTLALTKDGSETLTATITPSDADDKTVAWSSNATEVATVDSNGKVTAKKTGTATITATVGGESATCKVTVTTPVTSVSLNKNELALTKGGSETLTATITPSDADSKTVAWSSNPTGVATVDSNGKVTAKKTGTATITATVGGKSATCTVTVTTPVTGVTLSPTQAELEVGESKILTATIEPTDADAKTVTWTSSAPSVATVNNGVVTAMAKGETTITATSNNGKTATCTVKVVGKKITGISLDKTTLSMVVEEYGKTLTATITPVDADDKTINWESSNPDVLTVTGSGTTDAEGKQTATLTAHKGGTATVTAKAGNYSARCTITVTKKTQAKPTIGNVTVARTKNSLQVNSINISNNSSDKGTLQYSINNGSNWQTGTTFTGLQAFTSYTIYVRYNANDYYNASDKTEIGTFTTYVTNPYEIDLGKLSNTAYVDALRTDNGTSTVTYTDGVLRLTDSAKAYTITGNNAAVTVQTTSGDVTLKNAKLEDLVLEGNATLTVTGNNTITNAVSSNANLTITGSGKLNAAAIKVTGKLTINSSTITVTGVSADLPGITTGDMVVTGGDVTVTGASGEAAMESSNTIQINGGTVAATGGTNGAAISGTNGVQITGGDVTATGGASATAGTTGGTAISSEKAVSITGGDVTASGGDGAAAISGEEKVSLTGGNVTVTGGNSDTAAIVTGETGKIVWENANLSGEENVSDIMDLFSKAPETISGSKLCTVKIMSEGKVLATGSKTKGSTLELSTLGEREGYTTSWVDDKGKTYPTKTTITIEDSMELTFVYTPILVSSITVNAGKTAIAIGETIMVAATIEPADALDTDYTWSSSNPAVATVSENGLVSGVAPGTASIIATATDDSGVTGQVTITVNAPPVVDDSHVDQLIQATALEVTAKVKGAADVSIGGTYKLAPKKSLQLEVGFLPEGAEAEALTFESSNSKIAKVNAGGKVTAGSKPGKATITVTSESGLKRTVKIQVMKEPVKKVKITSTKTTVKVGKSLKLKAGILPSKKNASASLVWKSSNEKVATVTNKGVVKGISKGSVKITVTATDGSGKKATVKIKVK